MSTQPPLPAADSSNNQQQEENDDTTCVMAQGILSILGPIVLDIDKAIAATKQSQSDLGSEIDKLVKDLEQSAKIVEPPRLQPVLEKLNNARRRLTAVNKMMHQTQARVQRIQERLEEK
ncbi:hypothetical protein VTP01DRAFT_1861, partial [Rhizomucor pusillus]|uniref:uncharacterized protein n=1 Tax=Rhizomucor pusillus TaxID=4840 RepID=UPI0037421A3E